MTVANIIDFIAKTSGRTSREVLTDPQLREIAVACTIFDGLPEEEQRQYVSFLRDLRESRKK